MKVEVTQSCPTLCDTIDYTVHGILQARILQWEAFPFSRGSSQPRGWTQYGPLLLLSHFSHVRLCATPWMAAHQAPLSLGFSRQEHWSGLPFPSPMHESGKWKVNVKSFGRVRPSVTPWTTAYQAPPPMGFSRQEYWSGVPLPSPSQIQLYGFAPTCKAASKYGRAHAY